MSEFVIESKQLTKVYGDQAVVNAVDLHVKKGRIYGLLGRNGAGKTTIMKMILGLTSITSGEVAVFGQNIKGREKRILPRIGAIIETPGFYPNLTGTENLEIFAKLRGTAGPNAVKNALEIVGLTYKDKKLFSKLLSASSKDVPLSEIMSCIDKVIVDNGKKIVVEWVENNSSDDKNYVSKQNRMTCLAEN